MKTKHTHRLPDHLSVFEGDLYDNRNGSRMIREGYSGQHRNIDTVAQFKATLRGGDFAWPGGYPLYLITSDGAALSFDSARENADQIIYAIRNRLSDGWRVVGCDINYEDSALFCDHSGKRITSAYAEEGAN